MGITEGGLDRKTDGARKWGPLALEDVGGGVGPCHMGLSHKEV